MPRPIRIEYDHAYYHVINRGRGRQTIFHNSAYYRAFLTTLEEASTRFGLLVHAYCLMGNHYHLLLETPHANLSRIMQHINGLYTQRYNRLKKTDGPLFRGRYKAILVDKDAYLMQLSRYIHRNPIETKKPLVEKLEDYPWSSYPAYIGKNNPDGWLEQGVVLSALGKRSQKRAYQAYVELGVDEEMQQFFGKGNVKAVLGNKEFGKRALEYNVVNLTKLQRSTPLVRPEVDQVLKTISEVFRVEVSTIKNKQQGRQKENIARKVAYYVVQLTCDLKLKEIMEIFSVGHIGTVSNAISDVKQRIQNDKSLSRHVIRVLNIIQ